MIRQGPTRRNGSLLIPYPKHEHAYVKLGHEFLRIPRSSVKYAIRLQRGLSPQRATMCEKIPYPIGTVQEMVTLMAKQQGLPYPPETILVPLGRYPSEKDLPSKNWPYP